MNFQRNASIELVDYEPTEGDFRQDVLEGLQRPKKTLPCKYLYDTRGSRLFDRICELDEYYPTRTELAIMREHAAEMADALGPECLIVEYGSGAGVKIRLLLEHLEEPVAYVPVEISRNHLMDAATGLAEDFPDLEVRPVCADFTAKFELPPAENPPARVVSYFPGSTIGNFEPGAAAALLRNMRALCGKGGAVLVGVDLKKDVAILEAAYNDREGVTRDFNKNILTRINRELGADFRLDHFTHRAFYNPDAGRIEMHLLSRADQTVRVGETEISFEKGESIHTENSHKYSLEGFAAVAQRAGLCVEQVWTDPDRLFSVQYLSA